MYYRETATKVSIENAQKVYVTNGFSDVRSAHFKSVHETRAQEPTIGKVFPSVN